MMMKIDFELLEQMAAAGTPAQAIIVFLRNQFDREEAKKVVKRPKDMKRQRARRSATKSDNVTTPSDTERQAATLSDTPRARLFREGKPALLTMNIADSRAGALIVGWLKLTSDDDQLVLATILRAQSMAVADAPSWILATLNGKTNGNGTRAFGTNQQSAAIIAGTAAAVERRARERGAGGPRRDAPGGGGAAGGDEPEFFGSREH